MSIVGHFLKQAVYRRSKVSSNVDQQTVAENEDYERENDALRITRLLDISTHAAYALSTHICYVRPDKISDTVFERIMPDGTRERYILPEAVKKALTAKLLLIDLYNLTQPQREVLDRYLEKCNAIEARITPKVSDAAKADAHAKIDQLAAAADVELRMIKDTEQTLADMRLRMEIDNL